MAETEINVVGLSSGKKGGKSNWKIIGAIIGIVVLALGIIAGILLVRQQQDIREKAQIASCTDPTVEQCPVAGSPNILRNCHPPEANNSPVESLCDSEGKISFCGDKNYCCPSVGGSWTTDMSQCQEDFLMKGMLTDVASERTLSCSQGFTDNFDSVDLNNWLVCGDGVSAQSGVLVVKRDEAGTSSTCNSSDALASKSSFSGDFVSEVDIPDFEKSGDGGGWAAVLFLTDDEETDRLAVVRGRNNKNKNKTFYIGSVLSIGTEQERSETITVPDGPVSIKVERRSGTFSVYYKEGTGSYKLLKTYQRKLTENIQRVVLGALNTEYISSEYVLAKFDNFKISCLTSATPTPTATGIRTATPTATGIRTATPTATGVRTSTPTPTATGIRTATPTATGVRTSTPTPTATSGIGGGAATATATSRATATASSAPIPVTGVNLPTLLGTGFGIIMILVSLALAL